MREKLVLARNKIIGGIYKGILKPIYFRFDPEFVHDRMIHGGSLLGRTVLTRALVKSCFNYQNPSLKQEILGIDFANPIGLAAGFDKNADLINILPSVGFGFAEVGSITKEAYSGNPKPRLTRLKESRGIIVNYGLKSLGADLLHNRIKKKHPRIPIGISVAMTNNQKNCDVDSAIEDYAYTLAKFQDVGAYYTINISCPNTFGGLPFADSNRLEKLLARLDKIKCQKPVFIKLTPDLLDNEIDEIISVADNHTVDGFICSNLSKNRPALNLKEKNLPLAGGISGKPVQKLADRLIAYVYRKTQGRYVIIGCGGVFGAKDAYKKIKLGASLIQLISGMIFEGPQIISDINLGLIKLLKADGFYRIQDAIGVDHHRLKTK